MSPLQIPYRDMKAMQNLAAASKATETLNEQCGQLSRAEIDHAARRMPDEVLIPMRVKVCTLTNPIVYDGVFRSSLDAIADAYARFGMQITVTTRRIA